MVYLRMNYFETAAIPEALNEKLNTYFQGAYRNIESISSERKSQLKELAEAIASRIKQGRNVQLTFICTHNSRRSHMAQLWAVACSRLFGLSKQVTCYSGGTEATAFFPMALEALKLAGWHVEVLDISHPANPVYGLSFSEREAPVRCFSKVYDEAPNPASDYLAVMTCSEADEACPVVMGAVARYSLTYEDPKRYDAEDFAQAKYNERCAQIATEMLFLFAKAAENIKS